jgi:hypothetical protein
MNHHSLRGGATRVSNNVKDFNIFLLFPSAINFHYTNLVCHVLYKQLHYNYN